MYFITKKCHKCQVTSNDQHFLLCDNCESIHQIDNNKIKHCEICEKKKGSLLPLWTMILRVVDSLINLLP